MGMSVQQNGAMQPPSITQMTQRMFSRADADGNGTVVVGTETKSGNPLFAALDAATGGDGQVTMEEAIAVARSADSNGDDALSRDEFRALSQKLGLPERPQGGGRGPGGPHGPGGPGGPRGPMNIAEMSQGMIARLGTNGVIDLATVASSAQQSARGAGMLQRLAQNDGNGDGKVTAEEIQASLARFDTSGDGVIDQTEQQAMRAAMRPAAATTATTTTETAVAEATAAAQAASAIASGGGTDGSNAALITQLQALTAQLTDLIARISASAA